MKKTLALLLFAALVLSMPLSAFAEVNNGNDTSVTVTGVYIPAQEAGDTVSVDIAWDEMSFTYVEGDKGEWLPNEHRYDEDEEGFWEEETKTVSVTNHSNTGINATLSFEATADGVIGSFTESSGTPNDGILTLASAETAIGNVAAAPSASAEFSVSGAAIEAATSIGTITVAISKTDSAGGGSGGEEPEEPDEPEEPVESRVTTADQLAAAIANGGDIILDADISVEAELSVTKDTTLDLNGNTLTSSGFYAVTISSGVFTLKDTLGGGKISGAGYCFSVASEDAKLVLVGEPTYTCGGFIIYWSGGKIDLSGVTGGSYSIYAYDATGVISVSNIILPSGYAPYGEDGNVLTSVPVNQATTITVKPTE